MDAQTFSAQTFLLLGEVAATPLLSDGTIDIQKIVTLGERFVQAVLANPPAKVTQPAP